MHVALRRARNRPGGYWVAAADPQAASQAVTGTLPSRSLHRAALLSDGASRLVDPFRLATWEELLALLDESGPDELLRQVRAAEAVDPEIRDTEGGIARAMFRVAVSGRKEQEASFFTVVVWRDQAEHAAESLALVVDAQPEQVTSSTTRTGRGARRSMLAFRSVMSALSSFVVRSFSTNSRPALRAAFGRAPARQRRHGHRATGLTR